MVCMMLSNKKSSIGRLIPLQRCKVGAITGRSAVSRCSTVQLSRWYGGWSRRRI